MPGDLLNKRRCFAQNIKNIYSDECDFPANERKSEIKRFLTNQLANATSVSRSLSNKIN
jgi:hypothetical protein